jgi:Sterol carrier protein domain
VIAELPAPLILRTATDADWPGILLLDDTSFGVSMFTELHWRIVDSGYPMAALTASGGGIYGLFGYGPATIEQELTIDRRFACFHADAPDPGGVRLVRPAQHSDDLAAIYDRWRQRTPGGDGGRFALEIRDGRAVCRPTDAAAEIEMDLDVLGSLYLGAHLASGFAAANRLRAKDSELMRGNGVAAAKLGRAVSSHVASADAGCDLEQIFGTLRCGRGSLQLDERIGRMRVIHTDDDT